jgi:hypothetical protein
MFTSFEYLYSDTIIVSLSIDWSRLDSHNVWVLTFMTVSSIKFYNDMDYLSVITTYIIIDDISYDWTRRLLIIVTHNLIPLLLYFP